MAEKCENCRFFVPLRRGGGRESGLGECRRYPPGVRYYDIGPAGPHKEWPQSHQDDWCGEFQKRPFMSSLRAGRSG